MNGWWVTVPNGIKESEELDSETGASTTHTVR